MGGIGMNKHIMSVVRLHFVNRRTTIVVPWMIMAFIFLINLAIWAIIAAATTGQDRTDATSGTQYSGASFFIFIYMLVVAIQAVNITFPFALGYGVTRRDFYLGTSVSFVILSVFYGAALTVLSFIEQATHGWGLGGHMFTAIYFGEGPWFQRFFVFTLGMLFLLFVGAAAATVFVRWRANGLLVLGAIIVVILVGVVGLITLTGSWPAVGSWLAAAGPVGIVAWSLVPTVVAAGVGFLVLCRATPRTA
jgi:hypothetical protein